MMFPVNKQQEKLSQNSGIIFHVDGNHIKAEPLISFSNLDICVDYLRHLDFPQLLNRRYQR